MPRPIAAALFVLVSLCVSLCLAEAIVRYNPIAPRIQIVQLGGPDRLRAGPGGVPLDARGLDLVTLNVEVTDDGVPLFYPGYVRDRWRLGCAPDQAALRLAAFGSSILAGNVSFYDDGGDAIWSERMQAGLSARSPACISNLAAAGFTFDNQLALARRHLPDLKPKVVYWEIWSNSPQRWQVLGDRAYRFASLARRDGEPPNPLGAPIDLHRWLLPRSRVWEALTLSLATVGASPREESWQAFVAERLPEALALSRAVGAELVLVYAPPLDRPLAEQVALRLADPKRDPYRFVDAWANEQGVRALRLDLLLASHPVETIRLDTCCHYNARGHELIAELITHDLLGTLPDAL